MRLPVLAALALLATPFAATAQMVPATPASACAAMDKDIPAELAGWTDKAALTAATAGAGLPKAALVPGKAYLATLAPTPQVAYAVQPEKPGGATSKGGLFSLTIDRPAAYVIALGTSAWIDVVKDGEAARSIAHGHGPACATVRKMVTFDLTPGVYVVQISANAEAALPIMVVAKP